MSTIRLHQTTTSTPEQFIAGLTDCGPGRAKIFGNSAGQYMKCIPRAAPTPTLPKAPLAALTV